MKKPIKKTNLKYFKGDSLRNKGLVIFDAFLLFFFLVLFLFISCESVNESDNNKTIEEIENINKMRKNGKCGTLQREVRELKEVENCLEPIYDYNFYFIYNNLNSNCENVLNEFVDFISFDDNVIAMCGNAPIDQ